MNSILEFLLDMILDWDDIDDYTQYHRMPVEEQLERDRSKSSLAMFHESVGPQMWAEAQRFQTHVGIQDVRPGDRRISPVTEQDIYAEELSYRQYQESLEPGAGERAADKALEADLYRIGY